MREAWTARSIPFVEIQVDEDQAALDKALEYGDSVPIAVYPDGRVEVGFQGEEG